MTDHCSDLTLARVLAGESSAEELAATHAHTAQCSRCNAELDQALQAKHRFDQFVFPRTLAAVESRYRRKSFWRRFAPIFLAVPAMAAAALVVVNRAVPAAETPLYQSKGAASMKVFARRGERVFPVEDGAFLSAGDRLRFEVEPGSARFVSIGSIDGSGHSTLYYPGTRIDAPGLLEGSILLDDAAGPERIFAVFSDSQLEADRLSSALSAVRDIRGTKQLALPFPQASLLIEKSPHP
jgi:hypothetical protein